MKKIAWSEPRADIRRPDRDTAMRIFEALHRFAETDEGDIKKLQGEPGELRPASATTASASLQDLTTPCASILSAIARKPTADARSSLRLGMLPKQLLRLSRRPLALPFLVSAF